MTPLMPPEEALMPRAPRRDSQSARSPRATPGNHRRAVAALLALLGMCVWAVAATPYIVSLAPQGANLPVLAARWLSGFSSGLHSGGPVGAVAGSQRPALACTTQTIGAIGSDLLVPTPMWVCGDAIAIGGNVTVAGRVQGDTQAIGGSVTIAGEVDGDVTAVGGNVVVQPGGHVQGKLHAIGGRVIVQPGAFADQTAPVTVNTWFHSHSAPPWFHPLAPETSSFWLSLLFWVSATLGLTAFVPEAVGHVRYTIARRFLLSGVSGALVGFVGVLLAAALFLTCLGIPLTVVIGLALWLAWVIGTVAFGSWLGATLLRGFRRRPEPSLLVSSLLGVLLLSLLKTLPVAGGVVSVIVGCVGLGAAAITLISARRVSYAHLRW